jgi:hypothetical protein
MKKIIKYIAITSFVVMASFSVYIALMSSPEPIENKDSNSNDSEYTLKFTEVGYYKDKSKLRYYTVYIDFLSSNHNSKKPLTIDRDSLPDYLLNQIKEHGSKKMHTDNSVTATFYYLNKENTPDITNSRNQTIANEIAHDHKPLVAVWKFSKDKINVIKNP